MSPLFWLLLSLVLVFYWFLKKHRHKPSLRKSEAYEILGLNSTASNQEIEAAYKRLMTRLHPDKGGSDYLARQLNEARNLLLKDKT